ncbi:MAG: metallophosphoesterase [Bacteroidia bacterium]|nr:metallophosphoesterase [Bacteroidia bacterium]
MGIRLLFTLCVLLFFIVVEWYVGKAFKLYTEKHLKPKSKKAGLILYKISNWLVLALFFIGIIALIFKDQYTYRWTPYLLGLIMMIILPKLTYGIFIFFEDSISLGKHVSKGKKLKEFKPERRKFISQIGLIASLLPFSSVVHGIVRGRFAYKVHQTSIVSSELPEAFDGFKIVQFSDFHSGSFDQVEPVLKGLEKLQSLGADLLVFTGDMVNDFAEEVENWMPHLSGLSAPFGKYSILGNHDYGESVRWKNKEEEEKNLQKLKRHEKEMGFRLLLNEYIEIKKDGQKINLIGVENWGKIPFPQKGDLDKASSGIKEGEFNVLLSHDPSHWEAKVLPHSTRFHLTLSGHTHGAQMGVELPGLKWSPVKYYYPQWAGLYQKEGQHLYVNRGFGYVGIPARMGIWPEITLIELKKA